MALLEALEETAGGLGSRLAQDLAEIETVESVFHRLAQLLTAAAGLL